MKIPYTKRPSPDKSSDAEAAWTIHVQDGFDTQIGRRIERHARRWLLVFKEGAVELPTEREMHIFIQGVLTGRTLC